MTTTRTTKPERRGPGRPPGATRDATRARILRAARDSFAKTGYAGTTNADIAGRAGITAAALYQYFDSKTALYMAVNEDAQSELVARFRECVADAPPLRDALRALLLASSELHRRDPSLSAFLSAVPVEITRNADIATAMAKQPSEVLAIVVDVVRRGVKRRELTPSKADAVVAMFLACTIGLSLYGAAIDGKALPGAVDALVALMDCALFKEARSHSHARRQR
jgi:AcrR family transcriptional regulator